jgi:hypothetical protein
MKIEPIQNTFLQSKTSSYPKFKEKYILKKKEESKEKDLKESQDPRIIGHA